MSITDDGSILGSVLHIHILLLITVLCGMGFETI